MVDYIISVEEGESGFDVNSKIEKKCGKGFGKLTHQGRFEDNSPFSAAKFDSVVLAAFFKGCT